jgi:glycosyltransferase involved in cell wall biosynthesis
VPPADAGALAHALRQLLADGDARRAMGRRAQARAADLFDIDAHTATIAAIYHEVVSSQ